MITFAFKILFMYGVLVPDVGSLRQRRSTSGLATAVPQPYAVYRSTTLLSQAGKSVTGSYENWFIELAHSGSLKTL